MTNVGGQAVLEGVMMRGASAALALPSFRTGELARASVFRCRPIRARLDVD
jgi:uncharacterized protein YqhQ